MFWSNKNQRNPHPQEPADRCNFRLQNTFSEACFCFLSQCYNRSLQPQLAWVPSWSPNKGLGEGEEELLATCTCLYFKQAGANGGGLSKPCHLFTQMCHIGHWQSLYNATFLLSVSPQNIVPDAENSNFRWSVWMKVFNKR